MNKVVPYIISALIMGILAWYYFIFRGFAVSVSFVNSVVAFSAVFIIGLSFAFGPLARFIHFFRPWLVYRKDFGLIGFALAALHIVLVVPMMLLEETREFNFGDVASLAVAAVAFMIFLLMALTSTAKWVEKLGYDNWKNLQRMGYIAIVLVLFHVVLLEKGVFLTRIIGQIAIGFVLVVLLLRAIALAFGMPPHEDIKV